MPPQQRSDDTPAQEDRSKRRERADRILDATAELIRRWGYKKTTIDDIAKRAGVAKGTIYLHWKTREELFQALLMRENLELTEDARRRIANDPEGPTLHGMMKHGTLAAMKRPLMKAVLTQDTEMLGELARRESRDTTRARATEDFKTYLEFLRSYGLVRTDMSLREQVYLLSTISMGVLLVEPFLPDEFKLSDEEAADMLAETVRRTFEPRPPATTEELQEVSQAFNQYLDHAIDIMKERSQQEMES